MKKQRFLFYSILLVFLSFIIISSCDDSLWDEHYNGNEVTVDMPLWDAVKSDPKFSTFVEIMEKYGMDTLFYMDVTYTLFIPNNEAFKSLDDTAGIMDRVLSNHILNSVFLLRNVEGSKKVENLSGKFPVVGYTQEGFNYDGIPIVNTYPLYRDGVYYEIAHVAMPRPNLYEFTELYSQIIKTYIDLSDSVYLNKGESIPIGFDSLGNTIYDSVYSSVNRFERDFFPVSKEFRNKAATFVLFTQEQYDLALDEMADNLGPDYTDHLDIPMIWQNEVLLPSVLENSLFDKELEYSQFTELMVSVTGDSVTVNPAKIDPVSKFLCSNGLVYTYLDFVVESDLYNSSLKIEGEDLLDSVGMDTYTWKSDVTVFGQYFNPTEEASVEASGNAIANVNFSRNYTGEWGIKIIIRNVFPKKYRLEWSANFRPSGLYKVYVNDQILTYKDKFGDVMDAFDTYDLRLGVYSVTGDIFIPKGSLNKRDYWVENITEFGDVEIKIEYIGSGSQETNGFNFDYISLIPVD